MSYPEIYQEGDDGTKFLLNLLTRKEFFALKADPEHNFRDVEGDPYVGKHLKIHAHQLFVRNFMNPDTPYTRLHLSHVTGCHARDTPIMLYDGTIRLVQHIVPGDQLIGANGEARTVLEAHVGRAQMYECRQEYGYTYILSENHILTVTDGEVIVDVPLADFIVAADRNQWRHIRGSAQFSKKRVVIPPYYWGRFCSWPNKRIPRRYRCGSRSQRGQLLGGIIDRLGADVSDRILLAATGGELDQDILFVARSLGLGADIIGPSIVIEGNLCIIESRRYDGISRQRGHNPRTAEIYIRPTVVDDYYGFTLDGDGRFLGHDFTVLHNSGKTFAAISIAQSFAAVYKKIYTSAASKYHNIKKHYIELDRATPSIFVLGFGGTKTAFVNELLAYPELGFVSPSEHAELAAKQKASISGNADDVRKYKELVGVLRRRTINKMKDGFYKFYGYDEFVNKVFTFDQVKLVDLEAAAIAAIRQGAQRSLEDIIHENIKSRKIRLNQSFISQFRDSLIICDEIHNTYNTNMKNNRGVAIQFVVDSVPSVRLLTLSATPINNSPTEIVELINYLVPPSMKITKQELFSNPRTLRPDGLKKLAYLARGKFSFLQDTNPKYFPERIFMGNSIILPEDVDRMRAGDVIPYFKFVECPMSALHQETYNRHLETTKNTESEQVMATTATTLDADEVAPGFEDLDDPNADQPPESQSASYHTIPNDGYSIYDMVFPHPASEEIGLYRSAETRNELSTASQSWRAQKGIHLRKFSVLNNLITGNFLRRENLGEYSSKYATMVDIVLDSLRAPMGVTDKCEKIMIYHDRVKMSGVLIIQEILRNNNILDEFSEPTDSSLCMRCGHPMSAHDPAGEAAPAPSVVPHLFRACRFIMAHSDMDKAIMDQALIKYNSPDNRFGEQFTILVGSKIIKESFNFKAVQRYIIASLPVNISTLVQVLGRCVRKNSHAGMPPWARRVKVYMLVSTWNTAYRVADRSKLSPELYRYVDKILDYEVIQQINAEINKIAIDADTHRDTIMSPDFMKTYFPNWPDKSGGPVPAIGSMYFEPVFQLGPLSADELNLATFSAYQYGIDEAHRCATIIKQLFVKHQVWKYGDLWKAVSRPPSGTEINPALISEASFVIALSHLVEESAPMIIVGDTSRVLERIFDYNDKYVYIGGVRHQIVQRGGYYIAFPIAQTMLTPMSGQHFAAVNIRDKERLQIHLADVKSSSIGMRPSVDVETYIRRVENKPGIRISLNNFMQTSRDASAELTARLEQFISRYNDTSVHVHEFITDYDLEFQKSVAEQLVKYKYMGATDQQIRAYDRIYEFMDQLRIFVYSDEVRKYREVAKLLKTDLNEVDRVPVGYVSTKFVRLYDAAAASWIEVSKLALNRHAVFRENDTIVGYVESAENRCKFKLRQPQQNIKEFINRDRNMRQSTSAPGSASRAAVFDTRLIERGIVCSTKNKAELLQIIANLGLSMSGVEQGEARIKSLCAIIRDKLLANEIIERQKDSRTKYIYLFDAELPALSALG